MNTRRDPINMSPPQARARDAPRMLTDSDEVLTWGTSLIGNRHPVGTSSRTMPRALHVWQS